VAPPFKAAIVQLRTGTDVDANHAHAAALIRDAAKAGARFVATPEGSNILQRDRAKFVTDAPFEASDPSGPFFAALAAELGITLLIGSIVLNRPDGKGPNRSLLFGPDGREIARYDKIHLFDVNLGLGQESRESDAYLRGETAILADTDVGKIGLTICYDMRFPHLYRQLAQAGAEILAIPAAFTRPTGEAHWEVLLRARAIETGAWVIAPAQGGKHDDGRGTWGHSLIIDPWGRIVAHLDHDEPGFALAEIDLEAVAEARRKIPAWNYSPPYAAP